MTYSTGTSAAVPVTYNAVDHFLVVLPGEAAVQGSATGKTGPASTATAGAPYIVTVRGVDLHNNLQAGANSNEETWLGYRNPENFIVVSDAYPSVTAMAAQVSSWSLSCFAVFVVFGWLLPRMSIRPQAGSVAEKSVNNSRKSREEVL